MRLHLFSWTSAAKDAAHALVRGTLLVFLGSAFMIYDTERLQAESAKGLNNPTLSFNLSGINDYDPGMQFLDLMKMMRPWIGHEAGKWGGMTINDLRTGGYLDADGWVKAIPAGVAEVGTLWQWNGMAEQVEDHKGVYVLKYEGKGILQLSGDAKIISNEPGQITFENQAGRNFFLNLLSTDPDGTGDYIRDISIVAEKNVDLYDAGGTFNPKWLSLISDSRELRFMDWMGTNNSDAITWDDRPSADGPKTGLGVSVEDMVKLANELGVDPWFTMPHMADENYVKNFAIYVKENLDPSLHVKVEYSNETWNWAFQQSKWALAQSKAEWGVEAHLDYIAKKAVETALIWQDIFEGENDARLINVLGTQTNNPYVAERLLNPVIWKQNSPDTYVDPASVFEQLAVTSYFGGTSTQDKDARAELIAAILNPNVDANKFLSDRLMDPNFKGSIPYQASKIAENVAIAEKYGLEVVAYEGGQHVHHLFNLKGISNKDVDILTDFMINFVRSDNMADLYRENWKMWADLSDGAFMQFGDVKTPNKFGSWALYNGLDDENPRTIALEDLNATSTPWWNAEGGVQYQQGITATGTAEGDLMVGTVQEDYLLGGDGDDIFVAGGGNDGINGGNGIDRLVLSGRASDYTLHVEGKGYRLNGPEGSDFLVNVEQISFDHDKIFTLSDLVRNADGSIDLAALDPLPAEAPIAPAAPTVVVDAPVILQGGDENDTLQGSNGNDILHGYNGNDTLYGGNGADILHGDNGNDRLVGGDGNDVLLGGTGNDILVGGLGNDLLVGGSGSDKFIFAQGDGMDRITDFANTDILYLNNFLDAGQTLEVSDVSTGLSISNGEDRIVLLGLHTDDLPWMEITWAMVG